MALKQLSVLTITEYNLLANKDPQGSYDRSTREHLDSIIVKLRNPRRPLSPLENRLYQKFEHAEFKALEAKEKRVNQEVRRYRLSSGVQRTLSIAASVILTLALIGVLTYQFVLSASARKEVQLAWYSGLNRAGLVSKEDFLKIRLNLEVAIRKLEETQNENKELTALVDRMIVNNKKKENLKGIVKKIYQDPRTQYITKNGEVLLRFEGREIAHYKSDPQLWYMVGILETGVIRLYYNDEELMDIETIFGRKGEETPLGEYKIQNKVYKPTWYKKEPVDGKIKVRAIPFGDTDHEIGYWWLGLNRLGDPVPGSYGIHGVNTSKANEFFRKSFDWRSGSAGCPNVQEWFLDFLAKVVPLGTRVSVVQEDRWMNVNNDRSKARKPSSA